MKPNLLVSIILFLFLGLCLQPGSISAQSLIPDEPSPLFQSSETLHLTLTMNVREVLRDIGEDRTQHPCMISYVSSDKETISVPVQIRTRGNFRRDPVNCDFPPLRLNFEKETSENSIFEGQDKIKLVTHCRSRGDQYEQNVLKEYLVYRIYNLFTEASYRVRLVELSYIDSAGRKDPLDKMAFLLEPTEKMAARNHCSLVEVKNVQQDQCNPEKTTILSVFQYMAGNTDWSVPVAHNIDLIQEEPGIAPVAVPYDFDWSGMVNATYAVPAENLEIEDVRKRLFRGYCRSTEEFELAFQEFRDRKDEIYHTVRSVPGLNDREEENLIKYIDQFYKVLANEKFIRNEFYNKCRSK